MRILHVLDSRQLRGAEVFASDLIRALNSTNVSQRVAVISDVGRETVGFEAPVHVLSSDGWVTPGLRFRPQAARSLFKLVRQWSPDIIQAHGGSTHKYTLVALGGRRTKLVYRKIGPTPPEIAGPIRRVAHGFLMRRADRVVAVGEAVRRNTVEMFRVRPERLVTIPNAVDSLRMKPTRDREEARVALGISTTSPVMLSLGALTWEKDPRAHVTVGNRVLQRNPDAIHLIVGDGPMRGAVEAAIRGLGLERRTLMLGPRRDVADFFAASDVLLFASRPDGMESMNASVIEAGMLGVPAVAYAVGGVPEIVMDGVTGYLADAGNVEGLAARVSELLDDRQAALAMGKAAQERYLSRYDMSVIAPMYLDLYKELLLE